jgi:hypothetical protein
MENPFIDVGAGRADSGRLFLKQDEHLLEAVRKIANVVPKAYLVGGFVRDVVRGQVSKDADVEVYGMEPLALEECLEKLFPGQVIAVGRSFGVLKVVLEDGLDVDVAIPRRESKSGQGHTGFLIESDPNMSLEEALRRRDFTMNAMAVDPLTGDYLIRMVVREIYRLVCCGWLIRFGFKMILYACIERFSLPRVLKRQSNRRRSFVCA